MTNETSSGAVVYFESKGERKYLILHYEEGHFDFPKGHVEGMEKHEETALREIKEETGLVVDLNPGFKEHITYFFKGKQGVVVQKTVYFFVGKAHTEQVTLSHEHIGYLWLSYEHAMKKLTFDNAKEILKKADVFLGQKYLSEF
jgi:bis(5'-nucleosidyl)-tetraphosphatase